MKKETKQRIAIVCLGIPLSALATFVGGGLSGLVANFFDTEGLKPQNIAEWIFLFILPGLVNLHSAAPALLTIVSIHAWWCMSLRRHVWITALFAFILGGISELAMVGSLYTEINMSLDEMKIFAGTVCLAIVLIIEILLRNKLRGGPS